MHFFILTCFFINSLQMNYELEEKNNINMNGSMCCKYIKIKISKKAAE